MTTLHLTLKKKWFDMMGNGKPEEYRNDSQWIRSRLIAKDGTPRHYDFVCFRNGYLPTSPTKTFTYAGFEFRKGKKKWGAQTGRKYYVIKLAV